MMKKMKIGTELNEENYYREFLFRIHGYVRKK